MMTRTKGRLTTAIWLAAALAVPVAHAQQAGDETATPEPAADIEALEPGVDTTASDAGFATAATPAELDSVDDIDPGVPSAVLAGDIRRSRSNGTVMDRMELERLQITGNQELPKVLYIVPWQNADPGDLMGKPVNTLLDEVLAPIDREEFVRGVDYYGDVYGTDDEE